MQQDTAISRDDAPSVMPAIVLAAFGGGPLTAALLWKTGTVLALLSAPLGASLCGAAAAWVAYTVRRTRKPAAPTTTPLSS